MANIGERIKKLRTEHGDTQQALAEKLGITNSYISYIESGERDPSTELLEGVADIYNVDMNYLYGTQESQNTHRLVSEDEYRIVKMYRQASPEVRAIIDAIVARK